MSVHRHWVAGLWLDELADIGDTACKSVDEIRDEVMVFFGYGRRFMEVSENPESRVNPDFDFGLFLLVGRIQKIRGTIKRLFGDERV